VPTKQQRKTAIRKSRQGERQVREQLITAALASFDGPATRAKAETISNEQLRTVTKRGRRRSPANMDAVLGIASADMALAMAMVAAMGRGRRER
jgi:hypothetical protein